MAIFTKVELHPDRYGYIYVLRNKVNNTHYVGQHIKCGLCQKGYCKYFGSGTALRRAVAKYGRESFEMTVVENCWTQSTMDENESLWIEKLTHSGLKLYNIRKVSDRSSLVVALSSEKHGATIAQWHRTNWIAQGVFERSKILEDKTLIRYHHEGYPLSTIAARYNLPPAHLAERMLSLDLPCSPVKLNKQQNKWYLECEVHPTVKKKTLPRILPSDYPSIASKELVKELFVDQRLSDLEAGRRIGISGKLFTRIRTHYMIKRPYIRTKRSTDG